MGRISGLLGHIYGKKESDEPKESKEPDIYRNGNDRVIVNQPGNGGNLADVYVTGKGTDGHCHVYVDKDGNTGVVHRGYCDQCPEKEEEAEEGQ